MCEPLGPNRESRCPVPFDANRVAQLSSPLHGMAERAAFYRTYLRERDAAMTPVWERLVHAPLPEGISVAQWVTEDGQRTFGAWDNATNRPVKPSEWAPGPAVTGDL